MAQALALRLEYLFLRDLLRGLRRGPVEIGGVAYVEVRELESRLHLAAVVVHILLEKLVLLEYARKVFDLNLRLFLLVEVCPRLRRLCLKDDESVLPGLSLDVVHILL